MNNNNITQHISFSKKIGLIGITNILIFSGALITLPILTKNLIIEEYGLWIQILITVTLVPMIVCLGLPYTLVRYLSPERSKSKIREYFFSVFFIVLLMALISLIIFICFIDYISPYFLNRKNILIVAAFIIFFECLNSVSLNYFRAFQKIKSHSIFVISQTYLLILLLIIIILSGYGILELVKALLYIKLCLFLIMFGLIIYQIGFKFPKFSELKKFLQFGIPTIPSNFSNWIVNSSDRYLITIIIGIGYVGYYNPGYSLGGIIQVLIAPLGFLLPATLSKMYDNNNIQGVITQLTYTIKYFILLAIPAVLILSFFSKDILLILTTKEIATNGFLVTPIIACSMFFFGIYSIISHVLILKKKTKIIGLIWTIAAMINFSLNLILIPQIGLIGAAITTFIAYFFAFIITIFYSHKEISLKIQFSYIGKSVIAAIIISFFFILINNKGLIFLICEVIIGIIIYLLIIYILNTFSKNEIFFFKNLILFLIKKKSY